MYNPEKLELPSYDDPRLTEYTWSYDIVFERVWACEEEYVPETYLEISGVRCPATAFHLMINPEDQQEVLELHLFEIERINPQSSFFIETSKEILDTFGYGSETLGDWYYESISKNSRFLAIEVVRVRMLWEIRGWPGLTLELANSEILGDGTQFEFYKDWYSPEGAHLLESQTVEDPGDSSFGPESLRLSDPEQAASHALAEYLASPSPAAEEDLAISLIEFGRQQIYDKVAGYELATFHLPELAICFSCGRKLVSPEERICSECQISKAAN